MADDHTPLTDGQRDNVLSALWMAEWIAGRYSRPGAPLGYDDLYMAAVGGLIKAAGRYDPKRGASFATYAYRFAWRGALHAIRGEVRTGQGIPIWVQQRRAKALKLAKYANGTAPAEYVAERMGCTVGEARDLLEAAPRRVGMENAERIAGTGMPDGDGGVGAAVARLPSCLRAIVQAVYFEEQSIEDVARSMRLKRVDVRARLEAAHAILRSELTEDCPCD